MLAFDFVQDRQAKLHLSGGQGCQHGLCHGLIDFVSGHALAIGFGIETAEASTHISDMLVIFPAVHHLHSLPTPTTQDDAA